MTRSILLLVSAMNAGGAERVAANLVNAWAARGDRVTLLITYSGRGDCAYELADEVRLVYLSDLAGCTGRSAAAYVARFFALRRFIAGSRPEIIVSFLTNVNIATILASVGLKRKVIVSEHIYPPMLPPSWLLGLLRHLTYPLSFRVTMLTKEGLNWLHSKIPAAAGTVIPNPVSFPLPSSHPLVSPIKHLSASRKVLLAVGRLEAQKGFDWLLVSFAHIAPRLPLWDLVILGEGPDQDGLAQQIVRLKLEGRVLLPGRVGNMADWYSRADLYVMSSRFEGFPNTLVEAMAHGCAAVSYDCDTGPRDIIRHGLDGLLVRPIGSTDALAHALELLMGDDATRLRMASRALDVRERYSMAQILQKWDELFGLAIGDRSVI